jgi:hemerythrin
MPAIRTVLTSSKGMKGNEANISLAKEILASDNKVAVKELVKNLSNKNKNIQSDCIKTLYEIGYLKPELIADYHGEFIKLITSKNNRLIWGGMIALSTITDLRHAEIFDSLNIIMDTINKGSVITTDAGVEILARLIKYAKYFNVTEPLLMEQLWKCPIKQLPMYIEKSIASIRKDDKKIYLTLIERRKKECENDSQAKRLEKSFKQITSI